MTTSKERLERSERLLRNGQEVILLVRAGSITGGLRIEDVVEVMRPIPTQQLADLPVFVQGMAIVRGMPIPVIDLGRLLGTETSSITRFVTLKVGDRRVALGVTRVIGVRKLPTNGFIDSPPLIREVCGAFVERIGVLDGEFLAVLRASRILREDLWSVLEASQGPEGHP